VSAPEHRVNVVTYASRPFHAAQRINTSSAEHVGGFARVFAHSPSDIDAEFRAANRGHLRASRGAGNWLWKRYLVNRHLRELESEEWLFYCDAGAYFVDSIGPLVAHASEFQLSSQRLGGFSLWRASEATLARRTATTGRS